ncbi:MAG: porin [Pseudomonadota bacterium]
MSSSLKHLLPAAVLATLAATTVQAGDAAEAEIGEAIQRLQRQIDALKQQLAEQQKQSREQSEAQQARLEALAEQAEKGAERASKVTLGGYGELHYNNLDSKREIDFHRFVLFAGYDFSDSIRFVSEIELEHALAGESKPGEIELEQAYIEFDLPARQRARGGLFLVPVGILNETHEPTTFYGVERNIVESAIIPTTWWEAGGAIGGPIGASGLAYDLAVHSGLKLPTEGGSAYLIRSGRQKVAQARADDLAYSARLRYTGVPGLELAGAVQYQADATQATDAETVSALLTEAHVVIEKGPFSARALWASWDLDGDGPKAVNRDRQEGYFGEVAYRVLPQAGVFARYSSVDNGGTAAETKIRQTDVGVNWWPHKDVVIKADYQDQDNAADTDGYNLGIGYRF